MAKSRYLEQYEIPSGGKNKHTFSFGIQSLRKEYKISFNGCLAGRRDTLGQARAFIHEYASALLKARVDDLTEELNGASTSLRRLSSDVWGLGGYRVSKK